MKKVIILTLLGSILNLNALAQAGLYNGISFSMPRINTDGIGTLAVLAGTGLVLLGNEAHIGLNYCSTSFNSYPFYNRRVDGRGFNVELRRVFDNKNRIILGVQSNVYKQSEPNYTSSRVYFGVISDIEKWQFKQWKPTVGLLAINHKHWDLGLVIGSRLIITEHLQLEGQFIVGRYNLGVQLGTNLRYKRIKKQDTNKTSPSSTSYKTPYFFRKRERNSSY